jgi:hypothetical protein
MIVQLRKLPPRINGTDPEEGNLVFSAKEKHDFLRLATNKRNANDVNSNTILSFEEVWVRVFVG